MRRLAGKVVLVTGAGTGIGEAIAHKFAKEGSKVICVGLPGDPVPDVVESIKKLGGVAVAFVADVAEEENARLAVKVAIDNFGKLDVLINNAGSFLASAETDKYPLDKFDAVIRNNIRTVFLMTQFALPELQKTMGNIVAMGSESGMLGLANNTPYGGTKGWIHAFIKGIAIEQAKYGIRANCVCPSAMDEPVEGMAVAPTSTGQRATPEAVANVFAFLASDMASYVTGALYTVDGGTVIGKGPVGNDGADDTGEEPEDELD